jgi:hypothetical protein
VGRVMYTYTHGSAPAPLPPTPLGLYCDTFHNNLIRKLLLNIILLIGQSYCDYLEHYSGIGVTLIVPSCSLPSLIPTANWIVTLLSSLSSFKPRALRSIVTPAEANELN